MIMRPLFLSATIYPKKQIRALGPTRYDKQQQKFGCDKSRWEEIFLQNRPCAHAQVTWQELHYLNKHSEDTQSIWRRDRILELLVLVTVPMNQMQLARETKKRNLGE